MSRRRQKLTDQDWCCIDRIIRLLCFIPDELYRDLKSLRRKVDRELERIGDERRDEKNEAMFAPADEVLRDRYYTTSED